MFTKTIITADYNRLENQPMSQSSVKIRAVITFLTNENVEYNELSVIKQIDQPFRDLNYLHSVIEKSFISIFTPPP